MAGTAPLGGPAILLRSGCLRPRVRRRRKKTERNRQSDSGRGFEQLAATNRCERPKLSGPNPNRLSQSTASPPPTRQTGAWLVSPSHPHLWTEKIFSPSRFRALPLAFIG